MTLAEPIWLILLLPLAWHWSRLRSAGFLRFARAALYAVIVLALARPVVSATLPGGTIVVLADRSASMPPDADARQREIIDNLHRTRRPGDRLAVIAFAERPVVELPPGEAPFQGFATETGASGSNIGGAISRALSLASAEPGQTRALLLSDGRATDADALARAADAAARGLVIDARALTRDAEPDLAIDRFQAPPTVLPGERFLLSAWIRAEESATINYTLTRRSTVVASGRTAVEPGLNRLLFRDVARADALPEYTLTVEAPGPDAFPENNSARTLVAVRAPGRLLVLTPRDGGGLVRTLERAGLHVVVADPETADLSLESLASFGAVVLENVAIQDIGLAAAANLAALVESRGLGLLVTGGQRAFAAGGYLDTPLEDILPVDIEVRDELRQLRAAVVVALDRSGSMAVPVPGGQPKIRLAGHAAATVAENLSAIDSFGAVAVDSTPTVITPLAPAPEAMTDRLRGLRAGGGGIFVYEALLAAVRMIEPADAGARHVILFADAADAVEARDSIQLLEQAARAGITASVVGLGVPTDPHAPLLASLAAAGQGRLFFTEDANLLPQLFTQDVLAVSRRGFLDDPASVQTHAELVTLLTTPPSDAPPVGGYNPAAPRRGASIGLTARDDDDTPLLAWWNVGLGRVAAHTAEADGRFTGPFGAWDRAPDYWASLAAWILGERAGRGDAVAVQRLAGSSLQVDVHLDPAAASPVNPTISLVRAAPGGAPTMETHPLRYAAPDRLAAPIPLAGRDVVAAAVDLGDGRTQTLAPATLPYPPEFRPDSTSAGPDLLRRIAERTGGAERADLAGVWDELAPRKRALRLAPWLFLAAAALLMLEVAERRLAITAVIATRLAGRTQRPAPREAPESPPAPRATSAVAPAPPPRVRTPKPARAAKAPNPQDAPANATLDSLRDLARSNRREP